MAGEKLPRKKFQVISRKSEDQGTLNVPSVLKGENMDQIPIFVDNLVIYRNIAK